MINVMPWTEGSVHHINSGASFTRVYKKYFRPMIASYLLLFQNLGEIGYIHIRMLASFSSLGEFYFGGAL